MLENLIYESRVYNEDYEDLYFSKNDYTIYSGMDLVSEFGFTEAVLSDKMNLQFEFNIIPLFRVNIPAEMKKYLYNLNNKKIINEICNLSFEQMYVYFQKFVELNTGEHIRWRQYEKEILINSAIIWCKKYCIPYQI